MSASTSKWLRLLALTATSVLLSGCESTTTVNDGFGMTFQETEGSQEERVNVE